MFQFSSQLPAMLFVSCITENAVNLGLGFLPKKKLCFLALLFGCKFLFSSHAGWHIKPWPSFWPCSSPSSLRVGALKCYIWPLHFWNFRELWPSRPPSPPPPVASWYDKHFILKQAFRKYMTSYGPPTLHRRCMVQVILSHLKREVDTTLKLGN